jgi:hypothetical protein
MLPIMMMMMICNTKYDVILTTHNVFKFLFHTAFQKLHLFPSSDVRKCEDPPAVEAGSF